MNDETKASIPADLSAVNARIDGIEAEFGKMQGYVAEWRDGEWSKEDVKAAGGFLVSAGAILGHCRDLVLIAAGAVVALHEMGWLG